MRSLLFVLVLSFVTLSAAGEFLGIVPGGTPEELVPRLAVVGVTGNGVLVVGRDSDITAAGGRLLDAEPRSGRYVRVHPLDPAAEQALPDLGQVLDFDGSEYLMSVTPARTAELLRLRALVAPVDLRGWVLSDAAPTLPPVTVNPLIEQMVARVEADSVLAGVRRLQEFRNRYSTSDSGHAAGLWIAERFRALGCDTVIIQNHTSGHAPNIVALKYGTSGQRNSYAIVCGHYDAYADGLAPGADDNASGTAATMEALRVMRDFVFTRDLYFIAWSGEEFGLYGSRFFANAARSRGDSILGVINFDMIGYVDNSPEELDLMAKTANPPCEPFADFFIAVADSYTSLATAKQMMGDNQNSDHGPFWDNGYLAITGIEDFWPTNPHYHTSHDSIGAGYNDNAFCTEVTRAGVAALATLGEPVPLNQPLVGVTGSIVEDSAANNNGRWEAGETVAVYLTLRNYGTVGAHGVVATAATTDSFVDIAIDTASFGDIPGLDSASNTLPLVFYARAATPREHLARFDLSIVSAETTWQAGLALAIGEYVVTEPIPDGPRTPPRYWAYDDVDAGYAQTPVYDWHEINALGTVIDYPHNDDVVGIDLPSSFGSFRFYGQPYTRLSISADGWICPGVYTQRHYANGPLPDPANPPGLLCPNWDDLYPGEGSEGYVYWYHDEAGHRFIVEYDSVAYYNPRSVRDKFQVVIYDSTVTTPTGDNVVEFQYRTANRFSSSTVGIQDPTRLIAIEDLYEGALAPGAAAVAPGRAIRFTTTDPTAVADRPGPPALRGADFALAVNPVRTEAEIRFSLAEPTTVRLVVFDRAGRQVAELATPAQGALARGAHVVRWDAASVSRGIYFIRLDTPVTRRVLKAVVAR